MSTDSFDTISQVLGSVEYQNHFRYDGLNNHHPAFYTFLLWTVVNATAFADSLSFSVGCFLLLQSVFVSLCLAYSVSWIGRRTHSPLLALLALVFFTACPLVCVYSITMWKDIPFAAALLMFSLAMFDFADRRSSTLEDGVILALWAVAVSLLRNNGKYIALFAFVIAIVALPGFRKKLAFVGCPALLCVILIQGPLFSLMGVAPGHFAETVGVPLQQIAAVAHEGGEISNEQRDFLSNIISVESMAELYTPASSNAVKFSPGFNDEFLESHKVEFLFNWAQIVLQNPRTALISWSASTQGAWNPAYLGNWYCVAGSLDGTPTTLLGMEWNPAEAIPVVAAVVPLYHSGALVWVLILAVALGFLAQRKEDRNLGSLVGYMPLFGLVLTMVIAAPTTSDFRYFYPLFVAVPFVLSTCGLIACRWRLPDGGAREEGGPLRRVHPEA